jgi:hypothetical protein
VCLLALKHLVSLQARTRPSFQAELDLRTAADGLSILRKVFLEDSNIHRKVFLRDGKEEAIRCASSSVTRHHHCSTKLHEFGK